jgi:DNA mismatch repair protein MutS2
MQPGVPRALEFDRIVQEVRGFALTHLGDERLSQLVPSSDPQQVARWLAATTEAAGYVTAHGGVPLQGSTHLPSVLVALAIAGRALEPSRLLTLASFLDSVDETCSAIRQEAATYPLLAQVAQAGASFKDEVTQVRRKIDPAGDVVDEASPQLKMIRERLRKQRSRLRGTLESYLRGRDTAKYLQEQVVTERNGRYVLVVRAEHRSSIPGIVHGSSTSGASLFLEPLSTVEINNDIVALEEQEGEEVLRILLALSDAFRARAADLRRTLEVSTEIDVRQARGRFSQSIDGIEPRLSHDGAFELQAARHPLLKTAVPISIKIVPPATTLLITGPNTGGKTVALKTAGLLALMAQAGLRIPAADGSKLPVFREIFADIGDEQSIDANLSTFSGHIANIVSMDRNLAVPALVLLDEVGSGTDPVEGGALGVAVVDHFRRRGATVIATSHYDALKTYASTTEGVESAAFGFDAESFAPTYHLMYGSPGRSLALEIAAGLSLAPSIVDAARQNVSAREAQLAEHLAKIDQDVRSLEHERRLLARERESLETAGAGIQQREETLRQREESSRRQLKDELEAQVRRARREIDEVIGGLKARTESIAREARRHAVSTGQTGAVRIEARTAVDAVVKRLVEHDPPRVEEPRVTSREPAIGDHVVVGGLGLEAIVTSLHNGSAELDVRGKRMRSPVENLRVLAAGKPSAENVSVRVELLPRGEPLVDLNVIGCSVDEALSRTERFLDESLLTDQRVIRLVHGYGTGQLKRAIADFLRRHPLVSSFGTAPPEQGGGGVTVVELKD